MTQLTSAEIRQTLVDALQLDLVGPAPADANHAQEVLTQAPSKWYLTGFLAPFGARPEDRSDDTGDDELAELSDTDTSEDSQSPEQSPTRKALFPASMGLSVLISSQTQHLETVVNWGDYHPIDLASEPADSESTPKRKLQGWQRIPQQAVLTIALKVTKASFEITVPGGSGLILVVNCRGVRSSRFPEGTRAVSVFLVNYRQMTDGERDSTYAFQTSLSICCQEGFIPRSAPRGTDSDDWDEAVASLQYRNDYEFAVGHNVSAMAPSVTDGSCTEVCTTWIPTAEVPRVDPAQLNNVQLGMKALAAADSADAIRTMVGPMITDYRDWIAAQRRTPIQPPEAGKVAQDLLNRASRACDRMEAGLNVLDDPDVLTAFCLANKVIATARSQQILQETDQLPTAESRWRPFQLAFILLNLVSIAEPTHLDRDIVDLLFFPTGGGKTEAYLGLAAFTLVLRRLKNPGIQSAGLSVLMRYTLRLLTLDQLERASRLICALELERQKAPDRLGTWP